LFLAAQQLIRSLKLEIEILKKTVAKKEIELESTQFALDDGRDFFFFVLCCSFFLEPDHCCCFSDAAISRLNSSPLCSNPTQGVDEEVLRQKKEELAAALAKLGELGHRVAHLEQELHQSHESGFAVRTELEKQKRLASDHIGVLKETLKSSESEVVALDGLLAHVREVLSRHSTSLAHPELTKLLWEVGDEDESTKDVLPMATN